MEKTGFAVPPRFTDSELADFIAAHRTQGRMLTFNILIAADGTINPAPLAQLRRCAG